ncbi:MAG: hypothetical protein ABI626_04340 [Sphingomicrobium sp.]
MSIRLKHDILAARNEISAPPVPRACEDRTFGLPPVLHFASAALYLGFVSVLWLAFASPGLAVPYAIFVIFIAAFFAVPGLWARMNPKESRTQALSWSQFVENGIDTLNGRTSAGEAATLVLLLPVLIFGWALAVATIAALV